MAEIPIFDISVNRSRVGRIPRDDEDWGLFNGMFKTEQHTVESLAGTVIQQGYAIAPVLHSYRNSENFLSAQHLGLDYDRDSRSIYRLIEDPFLSQYASIFHTTSSHTPKAPRSRVLFILDFPVTSANLYKQYAVALNWYCSRTDSQCAEPARCWFGASGCEVVLRPHNYLPLTTLDALCGQYQTWYQEQQPVEPQPLYTPTEALAHAIVDACCGSRNKTGFWLACQLRDNRLDQEDAWFYMEQYQAAVKDRGDHPYTWKEAEATTRSAYKGWRRSRCSEFSAQTLYEFESFMW